MTASPLTAFLADPGRARFAGAAPAVSRREDDDPEWIAALDAARATRVALSRRGRAHGEVAVLPERRARPRPALARHLWGRARPFVVPGALAESLRDWRNEVHAALRRAEALEHAGGLAAWLRGALARSRRFAPGDALEHADPERDLERIAVRDARLADAPAWVKSARLSTHPADRSLRVRFGFGREVDDDASTDERRHRALADLAREACPEIGVVEGARALWSYVDEVAGSPLYATGAIVYWNAPEGGARMHHDAFADDDARGQRGVLYAQLAGRTFWLALSTADLARRIVEFAELVDGGELPWLAAEWAEGDGRAALDAARALADDPGALAAELAAPGQGRLGPLVDRGPEFTLFLVDSGHGALLEPGDVMLLPNHGFARTALHSVFCASGARTLALSFGLRGR